MTRPPSSASAAILAEVSNDADAVNDAPEAGTTPPEAFAARADDNARILKKYPNRRLYDTRQSSYITLADVKAMVLAGDSFEVREAKTGEDLTRSILLQIILEEETGGMPMFSAPMLAQIIRFYGHSMQGLMGSYLEKNLQTLTEIQARFAEQSKGLAEVAGPTPELWSQVLKGQAPVMQGMMGSYLEQSRSMFLRLQEQMTKQTEALFQVNVKPPGKT